MPKRGDEVETWIKNFRGKFSKVSDEWHAIDWLLDDYRLHADTGTPLHAEVEMEPLLTPEKHKLYDPTYLGATTDIPPGLTKPPTEVEER